MLSEYDGRGSGKVIFSSGSADSGGGGGGTNPGGGGGATNIACASRGGGGGGATNAGVGFGATIGGGGGIGGEVLIALLPALKIGGRLALLSCPRVIDFTDSGGPVVVEMLEREPGPVRRVFCWMIASSRSLTPEMLLRLIRMSTMAVRLR